MIRIRFEINSHCPGICYAQLLIVRDEIVQDSSFLKKAAITSRLESAHVKLVSSNFQRHSVSVANIASKMQGSFNARYGPECRHEIGGGGGWPQEPDTRASQQSAWFTPDLEPNGPPQSHSRTMVEPDRMRWMYIDPSGATAGAVHWPGNRRVA